MVAEKNCIRRKAMRRLESNRDNQSRTILMRGDEGKQERALSA